MRGRNLLVIGLSETASAVAHALGGAGVRVALAAGEPPKVHRRRMSLADVWWDGVAELDGLRCLAWPKERIARGDWPEGAAAFLRLDPAAALDLRAWDAAVDARLAKRAPPLRLCGRAPVAVGCGPGHVAGATCDFAVETQWGARLGAVIEAGPTAALAGEPRAIEGVGRERIVYAPVAGRLEVLRDIGAAVAAGETVARIGAQAVAAPLTGTLRGMLRDGIEVSPGDKLCEVDPRPPARAVFAGIGQRPAAIAAGVMQALARIRSNHEEQVAS